MMTFEEFFAKKKIDLSQLLDNDSSLYEEFRFHYTQMGEKSFDHTKKYWFNKLRQQYPLVEDETAVKDQAVATEILQELASNPTEKTTISSKPAGFKPRFKAGATKPAEPQTPKEETKPQEAESTAANKPAGFKPRFKAGVTKTAEPQTPKEETKPQEAESTAANKPVGFKPRFKAGATKTAEPQTPKAETKPQEAESTVANKPAGFKPRFKAAPKKEDDAK